MPKKNCDYSRTIIYKIVCNDLSITDCYVGHTTNFTKRKSQHKNVCNSSTNKDHNLNVYKKIRENGNWNNCSMIEIEKYQATDKKDLEKRERYWMETLKATLNRTIPTRTRKEYREENKEKIVEKGKEYYNKNKEKIADRDKDSYNKNKDKIAERGKDYYNENKDKILEKNREYHKKNKEHLNEKKK